MIGGACIDARQSRADGSNPTLRARQGGLTIVELMVSITLGLLVTMAAMALLQSSRSGYVAQDEGTRIQDTGRYAIESIARTVRQAAYENWDGNEAPIAASATFSANIAGLDGHSLKENSEGITAPVKKAVNGSDVLAIRFFGVGAGANGDGTMLNCAGFGVGAPSSRDHADLERGWSIFYVAADSGGEPELRCKYQGKSTWTSDAIARGVESFQVLYGMDSDADGLPNRFLNASAIDRLDDGLILVGKDAAALARDKNRKTFWKKVVIVKIALLVRGLQSARADALTAQYDLFGKAYGDAYAVADIGTRIKETELPPAIRNRHRKMFSISIQLRNQTAGSAA